VLSKLLKLAKKNDTKPKYVGKKENDAYMFP
jgi:hypothetical protein